MLIVAVVRSKLVAMLRIIQNRKLEHDIIIMIKGVPSTLLVHSRQPAERFLQKHKKNTLSRHENSKLDHPQAINAEMRQKSADPKKKSHKSKTIKPKKIRFVTEDIEKSTNNWLTIPSNAAAKSHKSPSKASSNEHHQEDAYQLTRTFKRARKVHHQDQKHRKHSEQIESIPYDLKNINKIKLRSPKQQSVSSKKQILKKFEVVKVSKCSSKAKLLPKTSRHSQATPQYKDKQFLSPEIVKHESSYCFQSEEEGEHKTEAWLTVPKESKCTSLLPPKRQTAFLFDSELSSWKKNSPQHLLRSTVDLLN